MKRFITPLLLSALLTGVAAHAHAQKVSLGLKLGPNFSTLAGSDVSNATSFARLIGGGFMVVDLNHYLALQPELLYAQKGAKLVEGADHAKLMTAYFEVPVLLRLQPAMGSSRFLPHAIAGPTIAYKAACQIRVTIDGTTTSTDCSGGAFELPIKNVDYGLALGGGVDMGLGRTFAVLDLRYEFGLSKIDDATHPSDVKNRGFAIMAGVRIPLGQYTSVAVR